MFAQTILITEIDTEDPDAVEFTNVSGSSVNISGWTAYMYSEESWPNVRTSFTFPANTIVEPCKGVVLFENDPANLANTADFTFFEMATDVTWNHTGSNKCAILLRNNSGVAIDFVIDRGNSSGISTADITSPQTIPTSQWTGNPLGPQANSNPTFSRVGNTDTNTRTDFVEGTPSIGFINPGLTFPGLNPAVASIVLNNPTPSPTSASSVSYTVTFARAVLGINTTSPFNDFALTQTSGTLTGFSVTAVSQTNSSTYVVTAATGSGEGLLRLDVLSGGGIQDSNGRAMQADYVLGPAYSLDRSIPTIGTFSVEPSPAGVGASVEIVVTFSENMDTGIAPTVSALTASNGTILATATGDGGNGTWTLPNRYEVSLNRALVTADHGTAAVSVKNAKDIIGNTMADASQNLVIDTSVPVVTVTPRTTSDKTPSLSGTISDNDATPLLLVKVDGVTYTPTLNGNGTWTLLDNIIPTLTVGTYEVEVIATDDAGNVGTDNTTGELVIEPAHLSVDSAVRLDATPTAAATVRYLVTFSSEVTGVETGVGATNDFSVSVVVGSTTGPFVSQVQAVNGSQYTVTVNTGSGDGVIRLNVLATGGIQTSEGGMLAATFTGGQQYVIARALLSPKVSAMSVTDPIGPTIIFHIEFSEPVIGIQTGLIVLSNDFELTPVSGLLLGTMLVSATQTGPTTYEVTAIPGVGTGLVRLGVLASGGIEDAEGTPMQGDYIDGPQYSVNTVAPTVTSFTALPDPAALNSAVILTFGFSELMDPAEMPVISVETATNGSIGAGSGSLGAPGVWLDDSTYQATLDRVLTLDDHGTAVVSISGGQDISGDALLLDNTHTFQVNTQVPVVGVNALHTADNTPRITGTLSGVITDVTILVTVGGQTKAAVNHGNGTWTLQDNMLGPLPFGILPVTLTATGPGGGIGYGSGNISIDATLLELTTSTLLDTSPTNQPTVRFLVGFSSSLLGIQTGSIGPFDDFLPELGPGMSGAQVTRVVRAGLTAYVVTVAIGEGDGILGLRVVNSGGLTNEHGSPLPAEIVLAQGYTIEHLKLAVQPQSFTDVQPGVDITFDVEAGDGTGPYHYQWRHYPEGKAKSVSYPVGEDSPTFTVKDVAYYHGGEYTCVVTDEYESVESDAAMLDVDAEVPAADAKALALLMSFLLIAGAVASRGRTAKQ